MLLLNQLRFSGYRSFRGLLPMPGRDEPPNELPLRRLTLIIGKNGAGKSQAARLLHQVLGSLREPGNPLFVSQVGGRVMANEDKDNFFDLNPVAHPVEVSLKWQLDGVPGSLGFVISKHLVTDDHLSVFSWRLAQGEDVAQGAEGQDEPLPWAAKPWATVLAELQRLGARSEALQGTRKRMARTYRPPNTRTLRPPLGIDGENAPDWLARSPTLLDRTREWMAEHLPPTNFDLDTSQGELRLIERLHGGPLNLADAAEGVQHVLPVITLLCARASEPPAQRVDSIEQPELHLHDAMHGALADLLLDAVGLGASAPVKDVGQRLLVETHSEGVLLRVRRRIAEGKVNPDDVGLCYVDRDDSGSTLKPIELSPKGDLSWWPYGVFLERLEDAKAIAVARRSR